MKREIAFQDIVTQCAEHLQGTDSLLEPQDRDTVIAVFASVDLTNRDSIKAVEEQPQLNASLWYVIHKYTRLKTQAERDYEAVYSSVATNLREESTGRVSDKVIRDSTLAVEAVHTARTRRGELRDLCESLRELSFILGFRKDCAVQIRIADRNELDE